MELTIRTSWPTRLLRKLLLSISANFLILKASPAKTECSFRQSWTTDGWVWILIIAVVLCLNASAQADSLSAPDVELLRFPFPYRAAVTVCSDTHEDSVERFEAVHTLINSTTRIKRSSPRWKLLFKDPEIDKNPTWLEGIDGFGLPIGDSIWLYNTSLGIFDSFDHEVGRPVPHTHADGRDYQDIIDDWIRRGWVDVLHTAGPGDISRQATEKGLKWLSDVPHRRLTVWVNHSLAHTPNSIEPDILRALPIVLKNIVKSGTSLLALSGAEGLARRIALNPFPTAFPPEQRFVLWMLSVSFVGSFSWIVWCLFFRHWRSWRNLAAGTAALSLVTGVLYFLPIRYAQGDNPGTRYYNADLVKEAGFKFFWLISLTPPYGLPVPEVSRLGRRSFLSVVRLDDGSDILVFPRSRPRLGRGGTRSLELLTDEALEDLVKRGQASILYTHWINYAHQVFTAESLKGLQRLKHQYEAGRIWVTPTSELLHFEFIRTFLQFHVRVKDGKQIIEIEQINDPIDGPFAPTVKDLRGISFAIRSEQPIEIHLAGEALPREVFDVIKNGKSTVVRFAHPTDTQDLF